MKLKRGSKINTIPLKKLSEKIKTGLIIIQGNSESPMNFLHNQYRFRQDSSFLYFFGLNFPDLMGIIDIDNNKEYIGGDDLSIDDIIWTGPQPTLAERSKKVGINNIITTAQIKEFLNKAIKKGRKIHFLPPYRAENKIQIEKLLGIKTAKINDYVSEELIKAVVELRSIKEHEEIEEIERIFDVAYDMHVTAMKMAKKADKYEQDIYGTIEGIALKGGGCPSFPIILTTHGETLHNHYHGLKLEEGKLMLTDAGAESEMGYATDITRTVPVGGKFTEKQKQIYNIVLKAEVECIKAVKPGIENDQLLKIPHKGYPATNANGVPGDLYLRIKIVQDNRFQRKKYDIHTEKYVDIYNILLGGEIEIKNVVGSFTINLKPGISYGKILRIKGKGIPHYSNPKKRGDFYIKIKYKIPENLSTEEKQLLKELHKLNKNK